MSDKEQPRLASALAQKVVDTIEPTINRHVNIMNAHGVIIASSDSSRVGTLHEASVEVLRNNQIVRVSQANKIAGIQPGVNIPLMLNDQLCGVVGVTGAPHEVEPLADLIALSVQLLLSQEREYSRSARRATEARDLLSALLAGHSTPEVIARMLEAYGLGSELQIELWIAPDEQAPHIEKSDLEGVRTSWVPLIDAQWRIGKASEGALADVPDLNDRYLCQVPTADPGELLAQAEAMRTLAARTQLLAQRANLGIWNEDIAVAVARTPVPSLKYLAAPARALNQEQARTLLTFATAPSMSQAAETLHIHRNTLMQRLERIGHVSGVDIRLASQSLRLQHAIYARVALNELQIF